MRQRKAYDLLIQAESGLASVTGGPEAPARVGVSVVDIATGMNAYAAILEALIGRGAHRAGRGHRGLDVRRHGRLDDGAAAAARGRQDAAARIGLAHPSISPYGVFETARRRRRADLDPERPRMARSSPATSWAMPRSPPIRISPPWSRASSAAPTTDGRVAAVVRLDGRRRADRKAAARPTSRSAASTIRSRCATIRTCAASPSARRPARCPIRRPPPQRSGEPRQYGPVPALGEHSEKIGRSSAAVDLPGCHCERSEAISFVLRALVEPDCFVGTQVGPARLAHNRLPISGKPEIGGLLAMTQPEIAGDNCPTRSGKVPSRHKARA